MSEAQPAKLPDNIFEGPWTRNPKIVDLNDLDSFVGGVPHDALDTIRAQYPMYWNEEKREWGPGFWNLTRYQDIVEVSRDTGTFSSDAGINISFPPDVEPAVINAVIGNMITMDPPEHRAYRNIAKPFFSTRSVTSLEARVRELARDIVAGAVRKLRDTGSCDVMTDIAAPLPISVLCDILGVPQEDWKKIFDWSNELIGIFDPDMCPDPEGATATFMELFTYGQHLVEERRKTPGDDLMTAIALAKPEDGQEIPAHLLNGFFLLMVVAGNETTRNSISGGIHALIENPEQRDRLVQQPAILPTAVEEILRWVSPVSHMRRTATRAATIGGHPVEEGDKVVMWYGAGNRDPSVFDRPRMFDVTRDPNPHIAFGIGEHFCLGSRLARLQLNVIFEELLRVVPTFDFTLAGDVRYVRTNFINGIKAMPATFTPVG